MILIFSVGANAIDLALLKGFLAASPDAPQGLTSCELEETETRRLVMEFNNAISEGGLSEVLRVLGGSAKGDDPMRVIQPSEWIGREAMPAEPPGARRWPCPRCAKTVIEGKNQEPGMNGGLCTECAAVDRKLSGARVIGSAPHAPAPAPVAVQLPAHLRPVMIAVPQQPLAFSPLPCVQSLVALHSLRPEFPTLVFVVDRQALAVWTGQGWRIVEANHPPVL